MNFHLSHLLHGVSVEYMFKYSGTELNLTPPQAILILPHLCLNHMSICIK